jgi:hypothetical protein
MLQRSRPFGDLLDKSQSHTRSLPDRFNDDGRFPTLGPWYPRVLDHNETGGWHTAANTFFFCENFVEGDSTAFGIAPSVGHAEFLKPLLDGAVFAVSAV